jgi:hypothetical protein
MAKVAAQRFTTVKVDQVQPHPLNPRQGDVAVIAESIAENDFYGALIVHEPTGNILVGSHRWQAARTDGLEELPAFLINCDEDRARRIMAVDNRSSDLAGWNEAGLVALLREMIPTPSGLAGSGFTEAALMRLVTDLSRRNEPGPTLADQFLVAPLDVLDGRRGWWVQRRKRWLSLGIKSELGRFEDGEHRAAYQGGWRRLDAQRHGTRGRQREILGRQLTKAELAAEEAADVGVSVFDPVLCELAYRWFCPPGGQVVDPFAGGSVRGIVAALLGCAYHGNDLSARQVAANVEQAAELLPRARAAGTCRWDTGDSASWAPQLAAESADLVFTCPPYFDTEVYSDAATDLSTMGTAAFEDAYAAIMAGVGRALRPDRFAVVVTGDSRGKDGFLRDLRGATIRAMAAAGCGYCSGAVHVTPVWSLASTAARQFKARRTLGRIHEDVLVFCKGSPSKAAKACGTVAVAFPETPGGAAADGNGAAN